MITLSKLASAETLKIPRIHSFVDTRILYIETKTIYTYTTGKLKKDWKKEND